MRLATTRNALQQTGNIKFRWKSNSECQICDVSSETHLMLHQICFSFDHDLWLTPFARKTVVNVPGQKPYWYFINVLTISVKIYHSWYFLDVTLSEFWTHSVIAVWIMYFRDNPLSILWQYAGLLESYHILWSMSESYLLSQL